MQAVDFNSDMGEGFGPWTIGDGVDAELMAYISSANIATGFHAGDPGTMRRTVERAKQLGVAIGAHPGFRDLVGFGRRHINAPAQELVDDMLYQLGALREIARAGAATNESHLLVLTSIILADEIADLKASGAAPSPGNTMGVKMTDDEEEAIVSAIDLLAGRIDQIANSLQKL